MKGFWSYFWIIYMLFFAIPFPMLLYYNTGYEENEPSQPWMALGLLALAIILWTILLTGWFKKWVLMIFLMRRNIFRLLEEGTPKDARVLSMKALSTAPNGSVATEISCSLKNFAGADITEQLSVKDTKPELRRYDIGKTVRLKIDEKLKAIPYLTIDGVQVTIKPFRLIMICVLWLLVAAAVVYYGIFSYTLENNGTGWRFLKFYHPLVLCPLILIGSRIGLGWLLGLFTGGSPETNLHFKYYGLRTDAKVLSAEQTGTYINEQPQVRFELQYQDDLGKTHVVSLKKIVSLMDLGTVKQAPMPVFYLKDKPEQVAFASDVEA
ncbi:hypothetical protein ACTJJ0_03880 [Chitinophaga sp. 22321]|uniref:Uncharacterized protein n=1 Tax=Chitinophaga hostae TaxID=2831022 RepID=A0ABS5IY30_9BACT|nr:hypothetical protein [Chitinophaga hostae]MBS0027780.1 hypothetical protein [Chitinophaga hostae]